MAKRNSTSRRRPVLRAKIQSAFQPKQSTRSVSNSPNALQAAELQLNELAQHLKTALEEKDAKSREITQLQASLKLAENGAVSLIQKMDTGKVTQEQFQKITEEQEQKITELTLRLEHSVDAASLTEAEDQINQNESAIKTLKDQLAAHEKERLALQQEKQNLFNTLEEAQTTIRHLEQEKRELPGENQSLKNQRVQMTRELEQLNQEISILQEKMTVITAQNNQLKQDNQRLISAWKGLKELAHWLKSISWHNYKQFAQQYPNTLKKIEAALKPDYLTKPPEEGFSLSSFKDKLPSFWQKKAKTTLGVPQQPAPAATPVVNNQPGPIL